VDLRGPDVISKVTDGAYKMDRSSLSHNCVVVVETQLEDHRKMVAVQVFPTYKESSS
jgi:hypothetical protein